MCDHAAFTSRGRDYYVEIESGDTFVEELCNKDLLVATNAGFYALTPRAHALCRSAIRLRNPVAVHQFCRNVSSDELTTFELCILLAKHGWTDSEATSASQVQAYRHGGTKIWFKHHSKVISRNYLKVLLKADSLFKQGLEEIHHMQSEMHLSCT